MITRYNNFIKEGISKSIFNIFKRKKIDKDQIEISSADIIKNSAKYEILEVDDYFLELTDKLCNDEKDIKIFRAYFDESMFVEIEDMETGVYTIKFKGFMTYRGCDKLKNGKIYYLIFYKPKFDERGINNNKDDDYLFARKRVSKFLQKDSRINNMFNIISHGYNHDFNCDNNSILSFFNSIVYRTRNHDYIIILEQK